MPGNRIKQKSRTGRPRPAARYIGGVTKELARLARAEGCETLSYLLELATIEAEIEGGLPEGQRVC